MFGWAISLYSTLRFWVNPKVCTILVDSLRVDDKPFRNETSDRRGLPEWNSRPVAFDSEFNSVISKWSGRQIVRRSTPEIVVHD